MEIPEGKVLGTVANFLEECEYVPLDEHMVKRSLVLVRKYDFQIFDAIIVASALETNCEILYTEDMQHGLIVENQLKIKNSFLQDAVRPDFEIRMVVVGGIFIISITCFLEFSPYICRHSSFILFRYQERWRDWTQ